MKQRAQGLSISRPMIVGAVLVVLLMAVGLGLYFGTSKPKSVVITAVSSGKPYGLALGDTLAGLSSTQLNNEFAGIAGMGVSWVRVDVSWADIQPSSPSQYSWTNLDRIVAAANSYHLKILGVIAYTPSWAAVPNCAAGSQKCAPNNDSQFADFAAAVASRYGSKGLGSWEIWNEPNDEGFWQPAPNPLAYTQLLQASYVAIKHVDPQATVISGGLGPLDSFPGSINQVTFLSDMYVDGAKPYFDAVGYHPYSYPATPSEVASWSGWSALDALPMSIRSTMVSYGDASKPIWITEYGAPTNGSGLEATPANYTTIEGSDYVSEALQADMLNQATAQYKTDTWIANFFWYSYQDLGNDTTSSGNFFGLLRADGTQKPAYSAYVEAIKSQ